MLLANVIMILQSKEKLFVNTSMEYIYQLDFPPIQDVVLADAFADLLVSKTFTQDNYTTVMASTVFQPQWLSFRGLEFTTLSCFHKLNFAGALHADDGQRVREEHETCLWAITWIYKGLGIMEYWRPSNIDAVKNTPQNNGIIQICETSKAPDKIYNLIAGKAYLTNVSVPHRPIGVGDRYAFSLRTDRTYKHHWSEVVQLFQHLIIA